jgi:hypothetical protein
LNNWETTSFITLKKQSHCKNARQIYWRKTQWRENHRKSFSFKTLVKNSSFAKMNAYNQLRSDFNWARWLTHYQKIRQLYVDGNASRKNVDVVMYHLRKDVDKFKNSSFKRDVESILFLSKTLFKIEFKYWLTKLKMIELVWAIKKITHMIKSSKHSTIIYIDHDVNSIIATIIKLSIFSTNRFNMKLMCVSMYFSQFRLNIRHRSKKFNIISDVLSRLSIKKNNSSHEALNMNVNVDLKNTSMKCSKKDEIYAYAITLVKMFENFRFRIKKEYQMKKKWTSLMLMLENLNKRREKNLQEKIEIDFLLKNNLLFHVKDRKRFCISFNCESEIFELAHDKNNHFEHNKVYAKLVNHVYFSKLSRKIRQYIKHCSACELNQIKRHAIYDELMLIFFSTISFRILTMNFIATLSKKMNTTLIVTCKTFKRMTIIFDKFDWTIFNWAEAFLDWLLITDWDISEEIISNRNLKFIVTRCDYS